VPQIIVTADSGAAFGKGAVTLRERVSVADFESEHFATQLVERLGWAVGDADEAERISEPEAPAGPFAEPGQPMADPVDPVERAAPMSDAAKRISVPSPA
jgi:hypothetical protein